jgi:hypothetical protein
LEAEIPPMDDMVFPDDIQAVADNIAQDLPAKVGSVTRSFASRVIARAILAERERCAKLADAVRDRDLGSVPPQAYCDGHWVGAGRVAEAIRKGA